MKLVKTLCVIVLGIMFMSCNSQDKSSKKILNTSISKIEVLDFHATHRCMTCNAIEANTKYTLNTYFKEALSKGKITFQVVNVDKKENEKIAKKFQASSTALFLNVIKNGEEKQIDLTEFAFLNGNNKEVFSKKLKAKIDAELKNI
ncbi:nitrophenyl compound nitroreductase subunit ArsF family protein [Neotamlana laminarinivorans]|uniref:Nitrophenyl compound nitroreductase subunit ArsF family protein n=1 Tax=Neotamlana laminarinivorans TaxID=2883124 RepID=A0A9X1HZE8_9FLAO|nr:nitrophenyl compound nitroreductase subunit ArsF family protein [Tamlana laminarinivorans]MCB4797312.1 nitrophenyl compound nitroreductase subunit ArsF family protein [Tamlana laminarinivorans]